MSVAREVARKLRAWEAGAPQPRYETLHHAIAPEHQSLVVAFVRMAGESRPWGIAWGPVGAEPTIRSVPDARVRDDVARICADFAEDLLTHMRVHNWTFDPVAEDAPAGELRQVWLPSGSHIDMLHMLEYSYSQTRSGGADRDILRALGRLAGWMFRDTSRVGNQHVVDASAFLRDAFVFPAQDVRTAHLGYQLAWLATEGDRATRMYAATAAERASISPALDPSLERDRLSDLVDTWQAERRSGRQADRVVETVASILAGELRRRWTATELAYRLLAGDPRGVNPGVSDLVTEAHAEFWREHQRKELKLADPAGGPAFVPHPETDFHGSAAASRYLMHEAADESYLSHLIHDDPSLLAEALEDGHAFQGTVTRVENAGSGRTIKPRWRVALDPTRPNRLRENGRLTPYRSRGHEVTARAIDATETDLMVTLEWTARKTRPLAEPLAAKPLDAAWEGRTVTFVQSDAASLTRRRSMRVWAAAKGPGAWLTHGNPSAPIEIVTDDGATDLIIDDVAQIESGVSP